MVINRSFIRSRWAKFARSEFLYLSGHHQSGDRYISHHYRGSRGSPALLITATHRRVIDEAPYRIGAARRGAARHGVRQAISERSSELPARVIRVIAVRGCNERCGE